MQITLRLDDWGVSYMLGELGEGNKGIRWTLLESGSWVSPGAWHSMCGDKRLVCDTGVSSGGEGVVERMASGEHSVVRQWKEEQHDVCSGDFEERRREVFCSLDLGQEKGCVFRLTDQQMQRAACGNQLRVLNLQTPTVLEGLRWVPVEQGAWEVRRHCFVWMSKDAKGHSFQPLDLDSELGRQQRALAMGKSGGRKSAKTPAACPGGVTPASHSHHSTRMTNGIVVLNKAGAMAPLSKAANARVGLGGGAALCRDLKRGSRTLNASVASVQATRPESRQMSDTALVLAAQMRNKDPFKHALRQQHKREKRPENRRESPRHHGDDCSVDEHDSEWQSSAGGRRPELASAPITKRETSHTQAPHEETAVGGGRPKRKRASVAVVEGEEATRDARKIARMKKEQEKKALKEQLVTRGLCLVEIPTDGHCLFSAINDQLKRSANASERQHTYKTLRRVAAQYMLEVLILSLSLSHTHTHTHIYTLTHTHMYTHFPTSSIPWVSANHWVFFVIVVRLLRVCVLLLLWSGWCFSFDLVGAAGALISRTFTKRDLHTHVY